MVKLNALFFIVLLLNATHAWALSGEIITLSAPLFLEKNVKAPVVQYLRKGDVIPLPLYVARRGPPDEDEDMDEQTDQELKDTAHINDPFNPLALDPIFYATVDKSGRTVFIPKKYVKVIYNDSREESEAVFPLALDETDYRLLEPLPKNYPLPSPSGIRAFGLLGYGQNTQSPYPYARNVINEGSSGSFEFMGGLARAAILDRADYRLENKRFFFGGMILFSKNLNYYELVDYSISIEDRTRLGIGPYLSYDAYQTEKNQITFLGGLLFNLANANITQEKVYQEVGGNIKVLDSRNYQGYIFSSRIGTYYQRRKIIKNLDLDFMLGFFTEALLPYSLKPVNHNYFYDLWNRDPSLDRLKNSIEFQTSMVVGIQTSI